MTASLLILGQVFALCCNKGTHLVYFFLAALDAIILFHFVLNGQTLILAQLDPAVWRERATERREEGERKMREVVVRAM